MVIAGEVSWTGDSIISAGWCRKSSSSLARRKVSFTPCNSSNRGLMAGNDLTTPSGRFPGLKDGCRWCLCVNRCVFPSADARSSLMSGGRKPCLRPRSLATRLSQSKHTCFTRNLIADDESGPVRDRSGHPQVCEARGPETFRSGREDELLTVRQRAVNCMYLYLMQRSGRSLLSGSGSM